MMWARPAARRVERRVIGPRLAAPGQGAPGSTGISALRVGIALALVPLKWFPAPFFVTDDAGQGLKLIVLVDLVLGPLLNPALTNIYNWVAIVAILACAVWVVLAVLGQSSALTEAFTSGTGQIDDKAAVPACPACGAVCATTDRFCCQCGKTLDAPA